MESKSVVYIVEDDAVSSELMSQVAQKAGFASLRFESAEAFLDHITPLARGCVILDIRMGGMDGLTLQREMKLRNIALPVIIASGSAEVSSAVIAMKQQAFDFFEKPLDSSALVEAICRAIDLNSRSLTQNIQRETYLTRYRTLTPRELEVMRLVVEGLANKQVAMKLGLSEKTIEVHRGNVMRKMQVDSVAELVRASIVCTESTN